MVVPEWESAVFVFDFTFACIFLKSYWVIVKATGFLPNMLEALNLPAWKSKLDIFSLDRSTKLA